MLGCIFMAVMTFCLLLKIYFLIRWHMCLCVGTYTWVKCPCRQKVSGLLELELEMLGVTWSGTELQSSARAIMLLTIEPFWQPLLCIKIKLFYLVHQSLKVLVLLDDRTLWDIIGFLDLFILDDFCSFFSFLCSSPY